MREGGEEEQGSSCSGLYGKYRAHLDDVYDPGVQQIVGTGGVVLHQLSVPDVRLAVHPRPLCVGAQIRARVFEFAYPSNDLSIPKTHQ